MMKTTARHYTLVDESHTHPLARTTDGQEVQEYKPATVQHEML